MIFKFVSIVKTSPLNFRHKFNHQPPLLCLKAFPNQHIQNWGSCLPLKYVSFIQFYFSDSGNSILSVSKIKILGAFFTPLLITPYFRCINKIPNGSTFVISPESAQCVPASHTTTLAEAITISCLYHSLPCLLPNRQNLEVCLKCTRVSFNISE